MAKKKLTDIIAEEIKAQMAPPPPAPKLINHVIFLLDDSG